MYHRGAERHRGACISTFSAFKLLNKLLNNCLALHTFCKAGMLFFTDLYFYYPPMHYFIPIAENFHFYLCPSWLDICTTLLILAYSPPSFPSSTPSIPQSPVPRLPSPNIERVSSCYSFQKWVRQVIDEQWPIKDYGWLKAEADRYQVSCWRGIVFWMVVIAVNQAQSFNDCPSTCPASSLVITAPAVR